MTTADELAMGGVTPGDFASLVSAALRSEAGGAGTPTVYAFPQQPSTVWDIVHNLGTVTAVTTVDPSGNQILGDVQHLSVNEVRIAFQTAVAGVAYITPGSVSSG